MDKEELVFTTMDDLVRSGIFDGIVLFASPFVSVCPEGLTGIIACILLTYLLFYIKI